MQEAKVRLQSLFTLSEIISPKIDRVKLKQKILSGNIDWLSLVEIANTHYLTAVLYHSLIDKDLLKFIDDDELLTYLEEIYSKNLFRNQQIVEQAVDLANILSQKNIKPVFLKGTASLLEDDYNDIGMRFLSDIDFCIFEDYIEEAIDQLMTHNYLPINNQSSFVYHHHMSPMYNSKWNVVAEPHKQILSYPFSNAIDCKTTYQKSIYGVNMYVLNPTTRLIHVYMHSDISDRHFYSKNIDLRQLYEMSLIVNKYKKSIDWAYIKDFFYSHGLLNQFNSKLYLISKLFSIDAPIMKENLRSKLHLKTLYLHFKYDHTFIRKLFIYFHTYYYQFSYKNIRNIYTTSTIKEYIYFSIKHFVVLIKRLLNKTF